MHAGSERSAGTRYNQAFEDTYWAAVDRGEGAARRCLYPDGARAAAALEPPNSLYVDDIIGGPGFEAILDGAGQVIAAQQEQGQQGGGARS